MRERTGMTAAGPNERYAMLRPYATAVRFPVESVSAILRSCWKWRPKGKSAVRPIYIIGCGRSGTSILGEILSHHRAVDYRFEPNAAWALATAKADFSGLYRRFGGQLFLDSEDVSEAVRRRYRLLFAHSREQVLVDKSPANALRLPFLDALEPAARYVHIARDGVEVSRSIERVANREQTRVAGRGQLNDWWGIDCVKWKRLQREGGEKGYFSESVSKISDNVQMGAYEWLVSLTEIGRWRPSLGERFFEMRYAELIRYPERELKRLAEWIGIDPDDSWVRIGSGMLLSPTETEVHDMRVTLPARISEAFNSMQAHYGFPGYAVADEPVLP